MDEFTLEKSFISTQMKKFKILFDKEADENLDLFLKYLNNKIYSELISEINDLTLIIKDLKEEIKTKNNI